MNENNEKMLGVIGGMGPEATKLFYKMIIDNTKASIDQEHLNMIILNHASMPDRTSAILSGSTDSVKNLLITDAKLLEKSGCSAIAIPCNTSHYFADEIGKEVGIPLINMIEETAKAAKRLKAKKIGILATDGTISTMLYQKALEKEGLSWAVPSKNMQKVVMSIIYDYVKAAKTAPLSIIYPVIDELRAEGCDKFILGCTELSVFGNEYTLPENEYIDAMKTVVLSCIKFCGKEIKE